MADPVRAGELRHRVTIEDFELEQNSAGEDVKTWSAVATRWARIRTLRGRELTAAQADFAVADVEVVVRYVPYLDEGMRVRHGSTYYDILTADDFERLHVWHILSCKTGASAER